MLRDAFPSDCVLAEETSDALRLHRHLLHAVWQSVNVTLQSASPAIGHIESPDALLAAIDHGQSTLPTQRTIKLIAVHQR